MCEHMTAATRTDGDSSGKLRKAQLQADENAVQDVISLLRSMHNPFDSSHSELFNISSGIVATPEASSDMKSTKEVGEKGLQDFIA